MMLPSGVPSRAPWRSARAFSASTSSFSRSGVAAYTYTMACTVSFGPPHAHFSGADGPLSPSTRCLCSVIIPSVNSWAKVRISSSFSPSAFSPSAVKPTFSATPSKATVSLFLSPAVTAPATSPTQRRAAAASAGRYTGR
ncbi:MAG: hypothetical protein AVDCRST_MAG89-1986 [uncultured Gemmatimonadetes bacterium]|uniref:Uncharacterized protein n=1 Tax=uncultured Gemmatimonadota bacterium TaxID=203437 RepID=A0A6J4LCA2_9BACT|nr:MAG: hypothetical protein AVDCRST_MAG89-1986 [uncultured Gemmatimonadota bacterium]